MNIKHLILSATGNDSSSFETTVVGPQINFSILFGLFSNHCTSFLLAIFSNLGPTSALLSPWDPSNEHWSSSQGLSCKNVQYEGFFFDGDTETIGPSNYQTLFCLWWIARKHFCWLLYGLIFILVLQPQVSKNEHFEKLTLMFTTPILLTGWFERW